jgi:hypothetical protein
MLTVPVLHELIESACKDEKECLIQNPDTEMRSSIMGAVMCDIFYLFTKYQQIWKLTADFIIHYISFVKIRQIERPE